MKKNSVTWNLLLIWGWSLYPFETIHIEYPILKGIEKKNINILLIDFANYWSKKWPYQDKLDKAYSMIEDICFNIKTLSYQESINNQWYLNRMIEWADIIYLWWWSPIKLLRYIKKLNLSTKLVNFYKRDNKTIIGRSAWAIIFFEKFLTSIPDKLNDWKYKNRIYSGLWLINWLGVAHFSQWGRQNALIEATQKFKCNGLWIDENVWILIKDKQYKILSKDQNKLRKYTLKDNKIVAENIQEMRDIALLYK